MDNEGHIPKFASSPLWPTARSSEVCYFGSLADCNIARSSLLQHIGRLQHRPKFATSAHWPTTTSPEVRYFGTWANCNIARSSLLRHIGQLQHGSLQQPFDLGAPRSYRLARYSWTFCTGRSRCAPDFAGLWSGQRGFFACIATFCSGRRGKVPYIGR